MNEHLYFLLRLLGTQTERWWIRFRIHGFEAVKHCVASLDQNSRHYVVQYNKPLEVEDILLFVIHSSPLYLVKCYRI